MPKQSLYNHFQRWNDEHYIAYSARSGAVALMTPEDYRTYQDLMAKLAAGQKDGFSPAESELLKQAEYGAFVRPDHLDELGELQFQHNLVRYSSESLGLVVAPTMACNMACEYCFEDNKSGRMGPEIQQAVVDFVAQKAPALGHLAMTWYGGEPLLAMDIITDLSERLFELGREHKFDYDAFIVSNGYLLTPEVVDRLVELKVSGAQVTLDGPAEIHNRKRPLKNGKDSFATIIENLQYALTKMPISIRVNVDQSFTLSIIENLLGELEKAGLREKVALHFGHLDASTKVCANIAESCFETQAFSKVEADFFRLMLEKGFTINKLPAPTPVCCQAQVVGAFVVDPKGDLYRCWNYIGDPDHAMGNIKDPLDLQHPNFQRLFSVDPFAHQECRQCSLLPVCMGGCPARRRDRDLASDQFCESWKYNLEPMLEIIAASKLQEQQKAAKEQS